MRICIRNTAFKPFILLNLRFVDWDTQEIYGCAICGLIITNLRICDLRTGTPLEICGFAIAE